MSPHILYDKICQIFFIRTVQYTVRAQILKHNQTYRDLTDLVQEKSVKCQQINSKILQVFLLGDSLQNKLICTVRVRRCEFASVAGSTAHKILQRVNNSHISRPNLNLGQQKYFSPIGKSVLCSRPCLHHHAGLSTLQVLNLSSLNKHIVKVSLTGFSVHLLLMGFAMVHLLPLRR